MKFVASGARHIAFISRSGDTKPEAMAAVDELTGHGAQVKVYRNDVADEASFYPLWNNVCISFRPSKE